LSESGSASKSIAARELERLRAAARKEFSPQTAPGPVAPCPTPKDEVYRKDLLEASKRTGIDPAALAALINAEAAKFRKSDPSTGALEGMWNPKSAAGTSSARGLTQFLDATWVQSAQTPGTKLNEVAKAKGLVDETGKVNPGSKAQLLALRDDPNLSIISAAEYGKQNLGYMKSNGVEIDSLSDDQKARMMYLAHHEGPQGAVDVLKGNLSNDRAQKLLSANVGSERRADLIAEHGSAAKAYTTWIHGYTNKNIDPDKFR
jgi:hypothetical protein